MMTRKAKTTLTVLILVCTLPVVASLRGLLLLEARLDRQLRRVAGARAGVSSAPQPLPALPWRPMGWGRWTMVYVSGGGCDAACESSLYFMRQVRTAQGEQMGSGWAALVARRRCRARAEVLASMRI